MYLLLLAATAVLDNHTRHVLNDKTRLFLPKAVGRLIDAIYTTACRA